MKTFKMLLLAIAALCVTACENDEAAYIGVPESIELSADASIIDFVVNSNSNWTLTVSDPWFKITPKHGSGKTTLKLGVDRNGVEGGRAVAKRCKIRFCGNIHAPPSSRGTPTRHGVG